MDTNDLILTAARATLLYFVLLFVVRVLGKREVGNITFVLLLFAAAMARPMMPESERGKAPVRGQGEQ